jgi:hypothetical protein
MPSVGRLRWPFLNRLFPVKGRVSISRRSIDHINETATVGCPHGKYCYVVTTGDLVSSGTVDKIEKLGAQETARLGLIGDGGYACDRNISFRIAHSIEHLTIIDLIDRGLIRITENPEDVGARTVRSDGDQCFFWIRQGLVTEDQEWQSVLRVVERINKDIFRH